MGHRKAWVYSLHQEEERPNLMCKGEFMVFRQEDKKRVELWVFFGRKGDRIVVLVNDE